MKPRRTNRPAATTNRRLVIAISALSVVGLAWATIAIGCGEADRPTVAPSPVKPPPPVAAAAAAAEPASAKRAPPPPTSSKPTSVVTRTWTQPTLTPAQAVPLLTAQTEFGTSADVTRIEDAPAKPAFWALVAGPKANAYESQIFGKVAGAISKGDRLTLRFHARALSPNAALQALLMTNGDPWTVSLNRQVVLSNAWRQYEVGCTAATDYPADKAMFALHLGQRKQQMEIAGIELLNHGQKDPVVVIAANDEWKPIDLKDPDVVPGSALDFSALVPMERAGSHGRVIVNTAGKLAFADRPEQAVRFFGCSINMGPDAEGLRHDIATIDGDQQRVPVTKEDIAAFVVRMRKQGYNLFRSHFLDAQLMQWSKDKLKPDPAALDRFDWLLHCCKENGIYLYFDAATRPGAMSPGTGWGGDGRDHKMLIYVDEGVRADWTAATKLLMTRTNPYTGTTLADDPMVAMVLFFNEQEIAPWGEEWFPNELHGALQAWLKTKYADDTALKAAWGNELPAGEGLANATGHRRWGQGRRSGDINRFIFETESAMLAWYQKTIRAIGYQGLTTQFDCTMRLLNSATRSSLPAISMHTYAGPAGKWVMPGSVQHQDSTILADETSRDGLWVRYALGNRFADRPMLVTEYQHEFWNRFRHEEGLMMAGYAAYQGFDCLMPHAHPVMLSVDRPALPYFVGADPIARSQQVVASLLFARGDVSPAKRHVQIEFDDDFLFKDNKANLGICWSFEQDRLALLTGYGIAYRDGKTVRGAVAGAKPFNLAKLPSLAEAVDGLRADGVLAKANRTDTAKGVFESDTGELLMQRQRARLDIVTPRTSAVTMLAGDTADVGPFSVLATSRDASFTAAALDGRNLADSRRMLVIVATNALNTNMAFADSERRELVQIGQTPILVQTGRFDLRLRNAKTTGLRIWGLGMDGSRKEELTAAVDEQGRLRLSLDTAKSASPWLYYEIAER
jgi:hypothetical protein